MFLTSFNVYFVFGYACFMCICLKTAIWLFLGQGLAFFMKTGWQPCCVENCSAITNAVAFVSTVLDLSLSCANIFLLQVHL